jgi:hypothetical protein
MSKEQRHFTRIPFNATATITDSETGHKFMAELIDISLKGALINKPDDWHNNTKNHYSINLHLAGNEVQINLDVIAVHHEKNRIGFKTEHMDLDSATHLHRLVELNLGDESLLERELTELIHSN